MLQNRGSHGSIAVTIQPGAQAILERLPMSSLVRQDVIHSLDASQFGRRRLRVLFHGLRHGVCEAAPNRLRT